MNRIFHQLLLCLFLFDLGGPKAFSQTPPTERGTFGESRNPFVLNEAPSCANGATFCQSIETYPKDHIANLLDDSNEFNSYFTERVLQREIEGRSDDDDDHFLCSSTPERISPAVAESTSQKWKYVAQNEGRGYTQIYIADVCVKELPACKVVSFPHGFTATCKQTYAATRLIALDESGKLAPDDFLFPSACLCSYRHSPIIYYD